MGKPKTILLPRQQKIFNTLGENIKFARLRRDFSSELIAERAGVSHPCVNPDDKNPILRYLYGCAHRQTN